MNTNVEEAIGSLEKSEENNFNYGEVYELNRKYPFTFYPLYDLQVHIIRHSFGEYWWESHKANVKDILTAEREKEEAILRKKQIDAKLALQAMNEEVVKKRMGVLYYVAPWMRAYERKKVCRIAAIESELDQEFKTKQSS